jgi:predicted aminopeptidase
MGYLLKSAKGQINLFTSRVDIEEALKDPQLKEKDRNKLLIAQEARKFAEEELGLKVTKNYTTFVQLHRPYVTYVVSAAPKWELKHHLWSFPILGKVPYKGFFDEKDALEEAQELGKENLDTYTRGVSAYSTLGWFKDSVLSSMLSYEDHILLNTIIHETVHTTLYIKSSADFNERLASFMGNKGMELYYLKKEGLQSPTLQLAKEENEDEKLFSQFISKEIQQLETEYKNLPESEKIEEKRIQRFELIQKKFNDEVAPKLKHSFKSFNKIKLNNARLLVYKTYLQDMSDFEELYELMGHDFKRFMGQCKDLESSKEPEKALKSLITQLKH